MLKIVILILILFITIILSSYSIGKDIYEDYKEELKKQYNYGYSNSTVDTILTLFNQLDDCDPKGVPYPGTNGKVHIIALEC